MHGVGLRLGKMVQVLGKVETSSLERYMHSVFQISETTSGLGIREGVEREL